MKLDRIIFGDNQFFGINHMSEEKAQAQAQKFKDVDSIIKVVDTAYDCGIRAFMFNTHDKVAHVCDHFRANPERYADISLYPSMPYAHKYAHAVNEKGMTGALNDILIKGNSAKQIVTAVKRGFSAVTKKDMAEMMKLLIDAEMKMFRGLNVKVIFLQNIVTDLLYGLGFKNILREYADYITEEYNVEPGFITLNLPGLVDFLIECGIENPIVCSGINKIGYLMNSDRESYEEAIQNKPFRPMAMSILASGAVPPREAVEYITSQKNIRSIVFGASSKAHIEETKNMIEQLGDTIPMELSRSVPEWSRGQVTGNRDRIPTASPKTPNRIIEIPREKNSNRGVSIENH